MHRFGLIRWIFFIYAPLTSGLVYQCNFQGSSHESLQAVPTHSFTQQLPSSRGYSHFCTVTTDKSYSFLRLKVRAFGQPNGSLHISIFDSDDASIGHMDISANGPGTAITLCPQTSGRKYFMLFTGTTNLRYSAEISDNITAITLNAPVTFNATKTPTLFKFNQTGSVSKRQLDITVLSSSTTLAYLKVSNVCKQAANTKYLDYTGSSLRLTFDKKGRITLSKASRPALTTTGFIYIGVALKDPSSQALSKTVKLTLESSFDYDYAKPLYFLTFLSFFGGILVSLWALLCFRDPYILLQGNNPIDSDSLSSLTASSAVSRFKDNLKSLFSSCWRGREAGRPDELQPLVRGVQQRTPITWKELCEAMKMVLIGHWFTRGPKTFSYTTCIVGFVLMVGAFQFVFEDWKLMISDGDRDRCYYNDFCYRVTGYNIPFNLMISNLAYMIHGLILALSVWTMEAELLAWCHRLARSRKSRSRLPEGEDELPNHCIKCPCIDAHLANMSVPHFQPNDNEAVLLHAEAHKRKYTFSIGYAFAWALIFEGCFSMLYHFCPTKLTFQFDTAFMFVIAGLIVLSLYNGTSYKECTRHGKILQPVESNNFFLFFIVPLYVFNYFGSLYYSDSHSLSLLMEVLFFVCLVAYFVIIFSWAGKKLFFNVSSYRDLKNFDTLTKTIFFIIALSVVLIVLPALEKTDFPNLFLFGCIFTSLLSISGKVIIGFWRSERSHWTIRKVLFRIFQGSYVLVTLGIMGTAVWIFSAKATTNKVESPAGSRDLNQDCALLGFFDYHDLWHIMSSFSLLMGAYLVLYISE